jgi:hypothetical protein
MSRESPGPSCRCDRRPKRVRPGSNAASWRRLQAWLADWRADLGRFLGGPRWAWWPGTAETSPGPRGPTSPATPSTGRSASSRPAPVVTSGSSSGATRRAAARHRLTLPSWVSTSRACSVSSSVRLRRDPRRDLQPGIGGEAAAVLRGLRLPRAGLEAAAGADAQQTVNRVGERLAELGSTARVLKVPHVGFRLTGSVHQGPPGTAR